MISEKRTLENTDNTPGPVSDASVLIDPAHALVTRLGG